MPTNVDDVIKKLGPARRKKVEARAAQLIAEEMTLQRTTARAQAHAGVDRKDSRDYPR